jgi:hypothetical protein
MQSIPHERIAEALTGAYPLIGKWQGRAGLVYLLCRFTRKHDSAYQTAVEALGDRSQKVREHACMAVGASGRLGGLRHLVAARERADVRLVAEYAISEFFKDEGH